MIKSRQQFAYLLNNFLALNLDAFISVGNELHSIPPTVYMRKVLYNILFLECDPVQHCILLFSHAFAVDRQTDRQTNRQRHADLGIKRQVDRQSDRLTDRLDRQTKNFGFIS